MCIRDRYLLVVEQNLVGISAVMFVVFRRHMAYHGVEYVKTRRHPENRTYISYRNAARSRSSHGRRQYAEKKLVKFYHVVFDL